LCASFGGTLQDALDRDAVALTTQTRSMAFLVQFPSDAAFSEPLRLWFPHTFDYHLFTVAVAVGFAAFAGAYAFPGAAWVA